MGAETNGVAYEPIRVGDGEDPLDRVLAMGGRSSGSTLVAVTIVALLLHAALAAQALTMSIELREWSRLVRDRVAARLQDLYEVELNKPPEPPPPPPAEVKEDKPAPAPPPVAKASEPPPPPPAPAQAGKVMTQEPDPNDPVDLTGGGFVSGNADSYAGGITEAKGTSKTAVTNRAAQVGGTPGGTGTAPAPAAPAVDKSRQAGLLGSTDWNCSSFWPSEADSEQIDQALVTIQVAVGPDGKAARVDIVKDPGHGFGLAARRCAMRESFQPGLDREGTPIPSQTKPFRVRFER
ncbi:MAG: energy transducer TonB [Myxococcales bacterium]|nr:energy transducer TonB [Myxococcales bacterium]